MVRAAWVKPMTLVQKFEANEAVAAGQCFQVVCESDRYGKFLGYQTLGDTNHPADLDGTNPWRRDDDLTTSIGTRKHDGNVCRLPNYNLVFENGTVSAINGWWIAKTVDVNTNGVIDAGDRVYWCNDEKYTAVESYKFNHWGTVTAVEPTHPNRS